MWEAVRGPAISLLLHMSAAWILASLIPPRDTPPVVLQIASEVVDELPSDEGATLELTASADGGATNLDDGKPVGDPAWPVSASLAALEAPRLLLAEAPPTRQGALDDVRGLATGDGGAAGDSESGGGAAGEGGAGAGATGPSGTEGLAGQGSQFFGVGAEGKRFVFVVDSSRSMKGKRWTMACQELLRAIGELDSDQSFYVIFFDAEIWPIFQRDEPEPDLLEANPENLKRLRRWMSSIHLGRDTFPAPAMSMALALKPDAIFLLSDGEFHDDTVSMLRLRNLVADDHGVLRHKITIHTIGLHSPACQIVLRQIAERHGGEFRFVADPRHPLASR